MSFIACLLCITYPLSIIYAGIRFKPGETMLTLLYFFSCVIGLSIYLTESRNWDSDVAICIGGGLYYGLIRLTIPYPLARTFKSEFYLRQVGYSKPNKRLRS